MTGRRRGWTDWVLIGAAMSAALFLAADLAALILMVTAVARVSAGQDRALDDAATRWHEAIAALDQAQLEAENLHGASPQLLADEDFWTLAGAIDGMTTLLAELIEMVLP